MIYFANVKKQSELNTPFLKWTVVYALLEEGKLILKSQTYWIWLYSMEVNKMDELFKKRVGTVIVENYSIMMKLVSY